MKSIVKTFDELNTKELYQLLQLRSEVFVVEQECVYQDIDGKDQKAFHVLGTVNDEIVAYTRVFNPGDYFEKTSIGRVVVSSEMRKYGYGKKIMQATLTFVEKTLKRSIIELSAQTYLMKFYVGLGFETFGEEYLEDGIPHIRMIKH
ncbi:GNAT family N-acetyltransferase [uncultured Croceitalea sp.]|uniref:GNAT family N-acetyltransferase n=1 Tax=uncultured Croceitalea sp. TaxID=1798908 RepID=UPI0033062627